MKEAFTEKSAAAASAATSRRGVSTGTNAADAKGGSNLPAAFAASALSNCGDSESRKSRNLFGQTSPESVPKESDARSVVAKSVTIGSATSKSSAAVAAAAEVTSSAAALTTSASTNSKQTPSTVDTSRRKVESGTENKEEGEEEEDDGDGEEAAEEEEDDEAVEEEEEDGPKKRNESPDGLRILSTLLKGDDDSECQTGKLMSWFVSLFNYDILRC